MTRPVDPAAPWAGATRPYDLIKEVAICVVAVLVLVVGLSVVFSSPDEKEITIRTWANAAPADFLATAATELDGTSGTAGYGEPYNSTKDAAQKLGPVSLQHLAGVTTKVDTVNDFVVRPLSGVPATPDLTTALATWKAADAQQQQSWASAYDTALAKVDGDASKIPGGDYGPVPVMLSSLLAMAQSGGLDGALLTQQQFYRTDYTKPLLFIADGSYLEDRARAEHLGGDQWGMMNETGSFPGQAWLWLYTMWYQVDPFKSSGNADALVWGLMMLLTLGFVLVPFLPGVRSIPRWVPVHRLIWRDYYREQDTSSTT